MMIPRARRQAGWAGRSIVTTTLTVILATVPGSVRAYGPMTHMGEVIRAVEMLEAREVDGLDDLASLAEDPEVRAHLLLGAILPDLREVAPSMGFPTHDRGFAALSRPPDYPDSIHAKGPLPERVVYGCGIILVLSPSPGDRPGEGGDHVGRLYHSDCRAAAAFGRFR